MEFKINHSNRDRVDDAIREAIRAYGRGFKRQALTELMEAYTVVSEMIDALEAEIDEDEE